ncbi:PD-(D/E)XK nuclease family protein [Phormidium sp. FACHB-592]|uniref:PD-(D/E)XK nuclease family protein n=1 Tax=Stenomitos frigidus AS-A4 TaxID=2933935 RepID=A0ABV0KDC1_9CYAN|nr:MULTISPECIES: PD-(D/E)XK nuclease family protein [Cyanophyceae]MBD2037976.1 PD-(D/E)XK nuclease family protein [Leptolyngbya sp. FACHB-321]MBD2077823.1 PD-(D/E)XK nuclease family protein [Phormidium sp. FACHB-592]
MAYQISATKLQAYNRCPYAYYLRYERKLTTNEFFGSASLGIALHQALAQCHRDWHYEQPIPDLRWVHHCWRQHSTELSASQAMEGFEILENYYHRFIASEVALRQPLAVEGRIQGFLQVENLEFLITGRYDRLDFLSDGLELIDYKSSREVKLPDATEIDVQIGLYYLALEQTYQQSLKYLSLIFLRTGEKIRFEATAEHRQQVESMISNLAVRLRYDRGWEPKTGRQCDRCTFARYCSAVSASPVPLPENRSRSQLQLALNL